MATERVERQLLALDEVIAALNSEGITKNMRVHRKVAALPTVDAISVVHGRWMPCGFGKEIMCSVCGCELNDIWQYRYCPDCGAKMFGGI